SAPTKRAPLKSAWSSCAPRRLTPLSSAWRRSKRPPRQFQVASAPSSTNRTCSGLAMYMNNRRRMFLNRALTPLLQRNMIRRCQASWKASGVELLIWRADFVLEHVFNPHAESGSEAETQQKGRHVLSGLYGNDRLAGDADPLGQFLLGQLAVVEP